MSPFEQQVRELLREIVAQAHGPTFHGASFDALAQRVAAAIQAATKSEGDTLEEARQFALDALAGAPSVGEPRTLGFFERVPTNPLAHRLTPDFLATRLRQIAADNDDAATDLGLHIGALEAELAELRGSVREPLETIRQFAREEITLARCAELLGVNIADAQFLRPLCPAVYSRTDFEGPVRSVGEPPSLVKGTSWTNSPSDLLEWAWGLLANAWEGDWEKAPAVWQQSVKLWRDTWLASPGVGEPPSAPSDEAIRRELKRIRKLADWPLDRTVIWLREQRAKYQAAAYGEDQSFEPFGIWLEARTEEWDRGLVRRDEVIRRLTEIIDGLLGVRASRAGADAPESQK